MLEIQNLTVQYGQLKIVGNISFSVRPQEWLMIVGPNGAGKSTVVSAISQGVPYTGRVLIDKQDVAKMKPKLAAKYFGVLTQNHAVGYSFNVEEVVRLGRYAHSPGFLSSGKDEDEQKISEAIEMTGLRPFLRQSVLTLSGGELQRTFLAQLFAQDPKLLLLDEPTNHLDLDAMLWLEKWLSGYPKKTGRAVISVVHDLNLAKAYGTHALLLDRGRTVSCGKADEVLTAKHLNSVYSMDVCAWMRQMLSQWDGE